MKKSVHLIALLVLVASCKGEKTAEGTANGKCFANDTCHEGLSCVEGRCVAEEAEKSEGTLSAADAEAAALELLIQWRNAQQAGDFDAYASLYGSEFTGVKRVGSRSSDFDRDSWLTDRRRMFRKPMSVTTADPTFHVEGSSVTIEFEQTWKQGSFEDRGRKRMRVRRGETWKIIREEMLDSSVVADPKLVRDLDRVAKNACACKDEACALKQHKAYAAWLGGLDDPLALSSVNAAGKREISRAATKAVRCIQRLAELGDVTTPPDPARCPKWFDRPDKWNCAGDCTGFCEGNF